MLNFGLDCRMGWRPKQISGLISYYGNWNLTFITKFDKVPDDLAARVKTAAADVIEMWFARAINAPSLSAVFGDAPPPG